jgi:pilus assembly protein CpaD
LTPSQRADVLAFAQSWRREATGGIIIDVPHGGPTDRAAADSMREVHSILAASGVPGRAVFMRTYRPSGEALASIKINYSKMTAEAGPCGLWPHDLGPSTDSVYNENRPHWNLGCANQRNLAAMVDNPADLVQPRGETPAYNGRRSVALDKYRKGENPSASYPNDGTNGYDGGKISDVGK